MIKVKRYTVKVGEWLTDQYHYFCPGCKMIHAIGVCVHNFNGDFERPTFTPSLLHNFGDVCHSHITDGKIAFLNDCWHELRGQTVDLPEFTADISPYEYQP